MKKIFSKIILLAICLFIMTGCSLFKSDAMDDIEIYTTIYPVNYLIKYLYGNNSTIYSIYPSEVNFKEYKLSDKKLNEYAKSSLYVFNSLDVDRDYSVEMVNINTDLKLIDVSMGMNYEYGIEELWLNPYNYLMMAQNTKNGLLQYVTNPYLISNKEHTGINDKYEELQYSLSKLDADYKDVFSNASYKTIVTSNEALKSLEKYGITVISLYENIVEETISDNNTLSDIALKYNINLSDILTYNNITNDNVKVGTNLKIPVKTIDSSLVNKVKKMISDGNVKYIYSTSVENNNVVNDLIKNYNIENIIINSMYSIDGGITNTNENYFTIMNNNLELFKKELYK